MRFIISGISRRKPGDFLLFGVTLAELVLLFFLTSTFTIADWIYVSQHLLVLGIALVRPLPEAKDHSLLASTSVVVAYAYPYAQVAYLRWVPGNPAWPAWWAGTCDIGSFSEHCKSPYAG